MNDAPDSAPARPARRKRLLLTAAILAAAVGGGIWWKVAEAQPINLDAGEIGKAVTVRLPGGKTLTLRYIPGGTFTMGSPKTELEGRDDEGPVTVTLSSHFWLAETELTQAQWEAVMGNNPSAFQGAAKRGFSVKEFIKGLLGRGTSTGFATLPDNPVEAVSWEDAAGFVKKLNAAVPLPAGWEWSLPTEAQWERACRGGTTTVFGFGDTLTSLQANFNGNFPYGTAVKGPYLDQTTAVKSYPANGYGLYDMHGNVWEWCADWWTEKLEGGRDPRGPGNGSDRVLRGGSWGNDVQNCRCACRDWDSPDVGRPNIGFRPAAVPVGSR